MESIQGYLIILFVYNNTNILTLLFYNKVSYLVAHNIFIPFDIKIGQNWLSIPLKSVSKKQKKVWKGINSGYNNTT